MTLAAGMTDEDGPNRPLEAVLLTIIAFAPLAFGCVEPWSRCLLQLLAFSLPLLCLRDRRPAALSASRPLLLAILALLVLAAAQASNPRTLLVPGGAGPFTAIPHATGNALLLWCGYAALLAGAGQALRSARVQGRVVYAMLLLGAAITVIGIIQIGQGNRFIYGLREVFQRKPFGPYYHRGHAASLLAMSFLLGSGLFLGRFATYPARQGLGKIADWLAVQGLLALSLLLIVVGLAWTQTRGATVTMCLAGIFVGFSACGFFRSRRRRWTLRLILLAAVAGFFLHVGRSGAWKAFHPDNIEEAASLRTSLYRNGGEIFQDYPWLGVGLGAFPWAYPAYQTVMLGKQVTHVHSDWLELLLETGFIGLLLYLAGLAGLARRALRAWREAPPGERRCLLGGVLAALLAFLLHQGIEFQFQTPGNAVWFFVLCGFFDAAAPDDIPKAGGTRLAELFSSRPGWTRLGLAALYFGLALAAAKPAVASLYALRSRTAAPASRPYFLSKALAWHASPDYAFELGATYLELAEANPGARTALLRLGLRASSSALAQAPQHPRYRNLQAAIIWRLGRVDDARSLLRAPMAARS